ncbi:MAG: sigma-54-dependent Fis family transcriptional regulator [Nitrospira sp.]|nr:sigma-54-dependent Fis family transcriptional regulator [bacterium]MBL7048173.1 sigma-54-dependent Fis family transcriptional regulator [Nitrospira sp.]
MAKSILIVEDEETLRESLKRIFKKEGYDVDVAASAELGLELTDTAIYDIILSDIILPGMDGIEMLTRVRQANPDQIFLIMTAYASVETAIRALQAGAYDYIMKPVMHEELKQIVKNALKQRHLQIENILLKREIGKNYDFSSVIGRSPALQRVIDETRKIADTKSNVLLLGETGTGKELFARVIHKNSSRWDNPFVPINCSVIPENLLESELFGHVKGAFTGAISSKKGLFEEADGGTIFLDEIGDISPFFQIKLLRVLEDKIIRPVGSTKTIKVDVRLISATNRSLKEAVKTAAFREDLFYRINTITLNIPSLRERSEDIPLLANNFLNKYSSELQKKISGISDSALTLMQKYSWPGNVRELQNVIERAILISDHEEIRIQSLPDSLKTSSSFTGTSLKQKLSIEDYTKAVITEYQSSHNELQLAKLLGITRKSLWEKRKKWGMGRPLNPEIK